MIAYPCLKNYEFSIILRLNTQNPKFDALLCVKAKLADQVLYLIHKRGYWQHKVGRCLKAHRNYPILRQFHLKCDYMKNWSEKGSILSMLSLLIKCCALETREPIQATYIPSLTRNL